MTQRPPDDPERIAPVAHPDDCDCDVCMPTACVDCGGELAPLSDKLCRGCRAIQDFYAGVVDE